MILLLLMGDSSLWSTSALGPGRQTCLASHCVCPARGPRRGVKEGGKESECLFSYFLPRWLSRDTCVKVAALALPVCLQTLNCPLLVSLHLLKLLQIVPSLNSLQITKLMSPCSPLGAWWHLRSWEKSPLLPSLLLTCTNLFPMWLHNQTRSTRLSQCARCPSHTSVTGSSSFPTPPSLCQTTNAALLPHQST